MRTRGFLATGAWFLFAALLTAGCDLEGAIEEPSMRIRISQGRHVDGKIVEVAELGTFNVSNPASPSTGRVFAKPISFGSELINVGIDESGRVTEDHHDLIFYFVSDDDRDEVVRSGVIDLGLMDRVLDGAHPAKVGGESTGVLHAFSIENLGRPSLGPLNLRTDGAAYAYRPREHILSQDYVVVHIREDDLKPFLTLEKAPVFSIEIESRGFQLNERHFVLAQSGEMPTWGTINGVPHEGSVIAWTARALSDRSNMTEVSPNRVSLTYTMERHPEHLEILLIAIPKDVAGTE